MRLARPRQIELRTEGQQKKYRQMRDSIDSHLQHFERCRINPMRIFEDRQHRLFSRQTFKLADKGHHRKLPPALWISSQRGVAAMDGHCQEIGKECRRLGWILLRLR